MKKAISLILAIIFTISGFSAFSEANIITAEAADYATTLKNKGFPDSYIDDLVTLHKKYPNWIFEPLKTGVKFATAVKNERTSHSKQLIEKISYYDDAMFCKCSSCYKNGNYVIQEASNWVSASEEAVAYYMDPRNFLDEEHIFQFESTAYDGTQTISGVEAILDGTWMHNSLINYKNTSGTAKQYSKTIKYSDAIMTAANDSGMSAYYLASKIKQENGSTSPTPTAVRGDVSPFQGIYNYYNIGAYSGAMDGLAWAAGFLKPTTTTYLYSKYDSEAKAVSGTKTKISTSQYMTWRATCGDYYYVRLYNESPYTEGKSGYVLKKEIRTTYIGNTSSGWGRPWQNPYKAIYYGAKYIAHNYGDQNSGYLQKFNVNPNSNKMYSHEYMANVAAAAAEAKSTYLAYQKADILSITKKFVIPVFTNMPNNTIPDINIGKVQNLNSTARSSTTVTVNWDKVSGADGYKVQVYRSGKWVNAGTTTSTSFKVCELNQLNNYKFRVCAWATNLGKKSYGSYSDTISRTTKGTITGFSGTSTNNTITLCWDKNKYATGYRIYKYNSSKKDYFLYKEITDGSKTSYKISNLNSNTTYRFKIDGYRDVGSTRRTTYRTDELKIKTLNNQTIIKSATSNAANKITVKWDALSVNCSGYQVRWSTTSDFSSNYLSVNASSSSTSKVLTTAQSGRYYYVKVRAYKTVDGKKTYYSWSKTLKVMVK